MHEHHDVLSRLDAFRYVAVCEHRTIHICWDNLSLDWQLADFRRFARLIRHQLWYQPVPEPTVQLRINHFTVGLPTAEFYDFANLVLTACEELETRLHQESTMPQPAATAVSPHPFALN